MGLGMSVLMVFKTTVLLLIFKCLRTLGFTLSSIPFLYASMVSLLICMASHPYINLPMLLGKTPDGRFPIWSLVVFSPYLYIVRFLSWLRRLNLGEEPYSEVLDGVYVGGWPSSPDTLPPGNPAIIDCTCEFPRKSEFKGHSYLCVPTWDTLAPRPGEIESAVKWACHKRAQNKPVFIHCAYGHGRSVTVTCALLVALGVVEDWKQAENYIKERRPYIHLNTLHRRSLEEWSKHRLSSPPARGKEMDASDQVLSNASGYLKSEYAKK